MDARSMLLGARRWRYAVDPPESIPPADVRHANALGAVATADELASIFAAAAPQAALPPDLGAKLVALCQAAHHQHPTLAIDDRALANAIGLRAPPAHVDDYLARCRAGDLALALLASRGVEAAIAELDRAFRLTIDSTCRRFATRTHTADDLKQILRERLFTAPGAAPKLADYAGQGLLEDWLRVVAVRSFLDQKPHAPDTCPDENELVLRADGALAELRRASIDRHLDGCGACTVLVAALAAMAAPVQPVPARYKIIRQLGAGAMGVVWEAEDTNLGRRVALKFVRTTGGDTRHDARRERLVREARALAQLRHPNVVSVYDVGDAGDELFLALALVIGTDARTWRSLAPRSTADILGVWRQVAAGLAAVHRAGIVHRDIKPDNVLVAEDGRVLLGDFGLATDRFAPAATNLTESGAIVGTPTYMAYEQLVGDPATQKSDQYALCASIWEALVGMRPFTGPTLGAVALAMQERLDPPPTMRPDIFAALARGLHHDPAKRWPTVDALVAALDGGMPRRTSRPLWLALGAAMVAATGTVSVLAWRDSSSAQAAAISPPPAPRWTATVPEARTFVPTPTEREPQRVVDWKLGLDRATTELASGDAGVCLDLLASMPSPPAAYVEQVRTLRATCMMKHGDCAGGRELFEAVARANHWQPAHLAERMRDADFAYCPLDAGPRERWTPRARYRLVVATGMKTSCEPVLAFMAKHGLALEDPHEQQVLEARCKARR